MNIGDLLTRAAGTFPGKPAVIYGEQDLDYAEFDGRVNRLAGALYRLGLEPGDTAAVLMHNRPEMLESIFACFKAGCAAVPLNFRLHPGSWPTSSTTPGPGWCSPAAPSPRP